jgi:DNA repair photolyase
VLRDIQLIQRFDWVRVGFSISSLSDPFYEPGVPRLEARLDALQRLGRAGIKTWVSLAPIAPQIVLTNFKLLFDNLRKVNVCGISLGMLRFTGYEQSKLMFEERTGIDSAAAISNGPEIMAEIEELAIQAGLDTSCSELQWRKNKERQQVPGAETSQSLERFL